MSDDERPKGGAAEPPAGWQAPERGEEWAAPELAKSKDLVAVAGDLVGQGKPAYEAYSKELILLAKQTLLPPEATDADLFFLFQLAGKYGLDPFAREMYLVPMKRKKKDGQYENRAVPIIGRDGLLALAEKNPYYRGHRAQVVREKDSYAVEEEAHELPNGMWSYVRHSFTGFAGARGAVLGAWCEVYLNGRDTVLFEAPLEDYLPSGPKLEYSPWKGMKGVMIRKVALVNGFREATRISGVYFEEEFGDAIDRGVRLELEPGHDSEPVAVPYPADPWWAERLSDLFDAAELARPGSHLPAKRALLLDGAEGEDGLRRLEADLVKFVVRAGGVPPDAPAPIEEGEWAAATQEAAEDGDAPVEDEADAHVVADGEQTLLA